MKLESQVRDCEPLPRCGLAPPIVECDDHECRRSPFGGDEGGREPHGTGGTQPMHAEPVILRRPLTISLTLVTRTFSSRAKRLMLSPNGVHKSSFRISPG